MKDIFFYWDAIVAPSHKFEKVREIYPSAKFVQYNTNIVQTAKDTSAKSLTKQFWLLDIDLVISNSVRDTVVPEWDQKYIHVFSNNDISAYLIPKSYNYQADELSSGDFNDKKIFDNAEVAYRAYDIYFYWKGQEPQHKFEGIKKIYPTAQFVKYKKNTVNTAKQIKSTSRFFWLVDIEYLIPDTIKDITIPVYDQDYAHLFTTDGKTIFLVPSKYQYDSVEHIDGHFTNKKLNEVEGINYRPYDIFFLSYDEENADQNFKLLTDQYCWAKRIHGVEGIFNAHLEAAKQSTTDFFWVVDADATIRQTFKFDYRVPEWDFDVVHIWNSRNPVNGLEYGYGGVKLIPKFVLLLRANTESVDVTTSIGPKIKLFDEVSNINNFASSPFAAWRSGFREAVKLSSLAIKRQRSEETITRLEAWCNVNHNHPLGQFVIDGAKLGRVFGIKNQSDKTQLALINDYKWLEEKFNQYVQLKKLNLKPSEISQK